MLKREIRAAVYEFLILREKKNFLFYTQGQKLAGEREEMKNWKNLIFFSIISYTSIIIIYFNATTLLYLKVIVTCTFYYYFFKEKERERKERKQ